MHICVHVSISRRGDAEPHVFFIGGCRKIVANILERWSDRAHRYFEVSCEDGRRFLLRHDTDRNAWELAGVFAAKVRQPVLPGFYRAFFAAAPKR